MRRSSDFTGAVRNGVRAGGRRLVVHCAPPSDLQVRQPTIAGFIVSKAVGGAVQRNRVKRRLRHLVVSRLCHVPEGSRVVVRALPAAAEATARELGADLDTALQRLQPRLACSRSRS